MLPRLMRAQKLMQKQSEIYHLLHGTYDQALKVSPAHKVQIQNMSSNTPCLKYESMECPQERAKIAGPTPGGGAQLSLELQHR